MSKSQSVVLTSLASFSYVLAAVQTDLHAVSTPYSSVLQRVRGVKHPGEVVRPCSVKLPASTSTRRHLGRKVSVTPVFVSLGNAHLSSALCAHGIGVPPLHPTR